MRASKDGNHIRVYDAYMIRESIKEINGRYYDNDEKAWVVPNTPENVALLGLLGVELDAELLPMTEAAAQPDEEPIVPMPIKAKPYQHQIRAFNFALRLFGIGDRA